MRISQHCASGIVLLQCIVSHVVIDKVQQEKSVTKSEFIEIPVVKYHDFPVSDVHFLEKGERVNKYGQSILGA